jgi:hypothetical protein
MNIGYCPTRASTSFSSTMSPHAVRPLERCLRGPIGRRDHITGARLHLGRASCLLSIPASELLNQAIPIAVVKGAMQNMRLDEVIERPNAAARRSALAQVLSASVEDFVPVDQAVLLQTRVS